jgi:hypothetical protein
MDHINSCAFAFAYFCAQQSCILITQSNINQFADKTSRNLFLKSTIEKKTMELSLEQAGVCAHMPLFLTTEQLIAVPLAFPAARPRT